MLVRQCVISLVELRYIAVISCCYYYILCMCCCCCFTQTSYSTLQPYPRLLHLPLHVPYPSYLRSYAYAFDASNQAVGTRSHLLPPHTHQLITRLLSPLPLLPRHRTLRIRHLLLSPLRRHSTHPHWSYWSSEARASTISVLLASYCLSAVLRWLSFHPHSVWWILQCCLGGTSSLVPTVLDFGSPFPSETPLRAGRAMKDLHSSGHGEAGSDSRDCADTSQLISLEILVDFTCLILRWVKISLFSLLLFCRISTIFAFSHILNHITKIQYLLLFRCELLAGCSCKIGSLYSTTTF